MRFGHPIPSPVNYTIADTKALIKALVCGIKLCTHAILLRVSVYIYIFIF